MDSEYAKDNERGGPVLDAGVSGGDLRKERRWEVLFPALSYGIPSRTRSSGAREGRPSDEGPGRLGVGGPWVCSAWVESDLDSRLSELVLSK